MEKPLGSPPPKDKTIGASNPGMDKAFVFIAQNREAEPQASNVDLKALRRRVDLHIVPIMFMCFVAQFLDKVLLNYAAVMSLNQDLGLKGNDFANANTFTYVALLVAEIPTGKDPCEFLLQPTDVCRRIRSQQDLCHQVAVGQRIPVGHCDCCRSRSTRLLQPLGLEDLPWYLRSCRRALLDPH